MKFHIDRLIKDEIAAHIENEVIVIGGEVQVNWPGIETNLQKDVMPIRKCSSQIKINNIIGKKSQGWWRWKKNI
ncbi:hypothetical protein COT97_03425 [Candidatus Falkowbacteria bacterium CG10_big_fil_rev_8_21_14_0_10_39_11]|uniref:Uncharacterized protein n=1 Tax=Candidatus Falkowbacteria bacterium CG10_big_fil_rev_8_21_14_0_10_39_11 TaxID=1974565 RepID=A0A2H0V4N8_9BACT|nr:MAG: hypothetical protein COT97_03425 [Candidatus Falkowbacteria bacterium CG10_big_fil_rev_8_21_14_0_10_39_11]